MTALDLQEHYCALLSQFFAGRKIILAFGPVAAATGVARRLRQAGAQGVFILGDSLGMGPLPSDGGIEWVNLGLTSSSLLETFRNYDAVLENLPQWVSDKIDLFDPFQEALVVAQPVTRLACIAKRPRLALDPASWYALEDKSSVDLLWDELAIPRPQSVVLPADADLEKAARALDKGMGTVWSGDASSGLAGGAALVKWVRTTQQAKDAQRQLVQECQQVRMAPFVEGIACSIHGVVFDNTVATFRPLEMVVFSRPQSCDFVYAGPSTYWDPPEAMRQGMRHLARKVGSHLRKRVAYRGAFSIDGIASRDGFMPTEINSRCAGGLMRMTNVFERMSFFLLELLIRSGHPAEYRPACLEKELTQRADATRVGGGATLGRQSQIDSRNVLVVLKDGVAHVAAEHETSCGKLSVSPAPAGCFVRFEPFAEAMPAGRAMAPVAKAVFALADSLWDTQIGALACARDVFRDDP